MISQAIMDSERAHYLVQLGTYFTDLSDLYGEQYAVRISHTKNVNDIYYNQAYGIRSDQQSIGLMLKAIEEYFQEKNRKPCLYITPASTPVDLSQLLETHNYYLADEESWMYRQPQSLSRKLDKKLSTNLCSSEQDIKVFSDIFAQTLGGEEGFDVQKFISEIVISNKFPPFATTVYHYLTKIGDVPVGIASAFVIGQYCGVYNVGTLNEFRGKGVAAATLERLRSDAEKIGARHIFLQTLKDGDAEKAFTHCGYKTEFVRLGYIPEKYRE